MADLRSISENTKRFRCKSESYDTDTLSEQMNLEQKVGECFEKFKKLIEFDDDSSALELFRIRHSQFLIKGLEHLSASYSSLDASRTWLCYWILQSMSLLDINMTDEKLSCIIDFLSRCQNSTGGFGGGPGQYSHLAPTYAAVNALCIIGTEEAYKIINREAMFKFIMSVKCPDGSFRMQEDGEIDIRGAYCAASVARLLNIATPEMFDATPEWIVSCQTYEGGFAGCPGMEAHGGYSFCGLAALVLLGKECLCDHAALLRWTAMKQMSYEGGFQGRTNKLVDGCYSFWQGGIFPILHTILTKQGDNALSYEGWMFHQKALQEYLLICCQHASGGLVDKPEKARDYYHTCYCLSGLSIAQHFTEGKLSSETVVGNKSNKIGRTHPLFNITITAVDKAHEYFKNQPPVTPTEG
ncbi:hypothetical protein HELRODRAFT_185749 [Helobdella robusta]|uniref:Protein farnesyltransferase subunit beta n=1 Tax=Helobdella robusta TaxID=6412 RepID=T1FN86_HELRO|nr:hypothetical protein HELRODRAFT_185749 [Helobdella robusta]ESO00544.1 hypothetical protein HELRODRAFT_185749 [Helobdella robusta]